MSLHDGHLLFQRIDVHETGSTPVFESGTFDMDAYIRSLKDLNK